MKNKILLPLIAIIFLSSCAGKFSLTKRKYTKGYYVASSKNNSSSKKGIEQNLVVTTKKLALKNTGLPVEENKRDIEIKPITVFETAKAEITYSKKPAHHTTSNLTASAEKKPANVSKPVKAITQKQLAKNAASKPANSDTNLIVLIILSLFPILALIAIYLHDGKTITLNFWIDLLLHLIFLYWLFALLVVLDVIDLK